MLRNSKGYEMKLNRLETHDRLQHFTKQSFDIGECCQNLINQRPFGNHPFYIFAHSRTHEDGVTKRLIWQPRLTRPKAQSNSMLFKTYPGTDLIKVIWMIPAVELWEQYEKGKLTENKTVYDSIQAYKLNRNILDKPEDDDLSDEQIDQIYIDLSINAKEKNLIGRLYGK
jgi:hypothetical protein